MVAPSFQSMTVVSDIYLKNGKQYIDVRNPGTGNVRSVRWYSDTEYTRQYGKTAPNNSQNEVLANSLKKARGFTEGPIILIRNTKSTDETWLCDSKARYAVDTGWYFISGDSDIPSDYPKHLCFMYLSWEEFTSDGIHKKSNEDIVAIIRKKEKAKAFWIPAAIEV